jgi:hypothetical protein
MTAYNQIAIRKPRGQTQKSPVIQSLGIIYNMQRLELRSKMDSSDPVPQNLKRFWLKV